MSTFFKVCPPAMYDEKRGGNRADSRNYLRLINGSEVFWMHLDEYNENVVRGLEINSYLIDQAEEIPESIYLHLDARIGRWDEAEVPEHMNPERYPKNRATGKPMPPSYGMILCNPDAFSHWIYQRYHPDSPAHAMPRERYDRTTGGKITYSYADTHKMIQATAYDNPALAEETIQAMESRGEGFVRRYVKGIWGTPEGAVHEVSGKSKLYDVNPEFLSNVIKKGKLYRALDHGDAAPTAVLWLSRYKEWIFAYQEYYVPQELISKHRENINALSMDENGVYQNFVQTVCDPSMANKTQQKKGGLFSLIDEYATSEYETPPIHLTPADNNEFLTRSRISEALRPHPHIKHPITGESNAPVLYFIMKTANYPNGCNHVVIETESQKYKKLGTLDGEDIYGDDRDPSIADHAYDALRYGLVTIYQTKQLQEKPKYSENSFKKVRDRAVRQQRKFKQLAGMHSRSVLPLR